MNISQKRRVIDRFLILFAAIIAASFVYKGFFNVEESEYLNETSIEDQSQ